jgi:type VI secretion system protein ImpA
MPLPEVLLQPIPGENPSGTSLRYDPVFDAIREARREEESLSTGVWSREVKKANFPRVIELCSGALQSKTKDLQIGAWLCEALLVSEGLPGLIQGLNLVRGFLQDFWPTLYPEIEDDDPESRLGPIEWVATRLEGRVRRVPLTRTKLDWLKYEESRRIGYESDAAGDEAKIGMRRQAIQDKKCTAEEFDEGARNTPPAFYEKLNQDLSAASEAINALESVSDEKFGKLAPSFGSLRKAISDLEEVVHQHWQPALPPAEVASQEESHDVVGDAVDSTSAAASTSAAPPRLKSTSEEPANHEDAFRRLGQIAKYLRKEDPSNPAGYLILRTARWGELRRNGSGVDSSLLDPPPTEVRQSLKRLATEGLWNELLEMAEEAMASPWSRAWLDLQRFTIKACESLGLSAVSAAICSELRALLSDMPSLTLAVLCDDTPAANAETQSWLLQSILPTPPSSQNQEQPLPKLNSSPTQTKAEPDVYELALRAAREGKVQESIEMISREILNERSGRGRFNRKVQLAGICVAVKRESLAYPILTELSEEIENRKLEEWEEAESLAHTLGLLLRCADSLGADESTRKKIFQKICRLDPIQALSVMR